MKKLWKKKKRKEKRAQQRKEKRKEFQKDGQEKDGSSAHVKKRAKKPLQDAPNATQRVKCRPPFCALKPRKRFLGFGGWMFLGLLLVDLPQASASHVTWSEFTGLSKPPSAVVSRPLVQWS